MQHEDFRDQCKQEAAAVKAAYSAFKTATRGQTLADIMIPDRNNNSRVTLSRSTSLGSTIIPPPPPLSSLRRKLINNHSLFHMYENTDGSMQNEMISITTPTNGSLPSLSLSNIDMDNDDIHTNISPSHDPNTDRNDYIMRQLSLPVSNHPRLSHSVPLKTTNPYPITTTTPFSPTGSMSPLAVAFASLANDD